MGGQFMASHDAHNLNALFVKKKNLESIATGWVYI